MNIVVFHRLSHVRQQLHPVFAFTSNDSCNLLTHQEGLLSEDEPVSFFFISMLISLRLHCSLYHLITILVAWYSSWRVPCFDYRLRSSSHHSSEVSKRRTCWLNLPKVNDARLQLLGIGIFLINKSSMTMVCSFIPHGVKSHWESMWFIYLMSCL